MSKKTVDIVDKSLMKDVLNKEHLSNLHDKDNITSNDKTGLNLIESIFFFSVVGSVILTCFIFKI